jgi:RNA polymerase sigma-70 factor (ECF subfamily)
VRLEELFALHQAELFRFAARFTGDRDLAEDIVQDVFVRLAERPPRDGTHVRAWLFRVATTIAIDVQRLERRRTRLVREEPSRGPMGAPPPDPQREAERHEVQDRVRDALAALSERERSILLMREEGFAHHEIAEAVGTTTGSVGTMIARALEKLARHLDLDAEDVP